MAGVGGAPVHNRHIGRGYILPIAVRWTLTPVYSTRLCSSKYYGPSVTVPDWGSGICGLFGADSQPSAYDVVDLVGSGSTWNTYQHVWTGVIKDMSLNVLYNRQLD
jgi:hypothetical protein